MVRTQIQLTEEQSKYLKKLSAELDVSVAEIIRRAVNRYIEDGKGPSREEIKKNAIEAVGKFSSKEKDLSINHDKYLAEVYGK